MTHVSDLFDPSVWRDVPGFDALTDITYHLDVAGRVARIAFNRPEVRNAFRPHTVDELYRAQPPSFALGPFPVSSTTPTRGFWRASSRAR